MVKRRMQCIKNPKLWWLSHLWMWPLNKFCFNAGFISNKVQSTSSFSYNVNRMWNINVRIGSHSYQLFMLQVSFLNLKLIRLNYYILIIQMILSSNTFAISHRLIWKWHILFNTNNKRQIQLNLWFLGDLFVS